MTTLVTDPAHHDFLRAHAVSLLEFAKDFPAPVGGSGWLDNDGRVDLTQSVHTWITCRMAHSYSVGALMGVPGAKERAQVALDGLRGPLKDQINGGWFAAIPATGSGDHRTDDPVSMVGVDSTKAAYAHAFVVLAASSGVRAGLDGAQELLEEALAVLDSKFFEPAYGLHADEWDATFSTLDPYRGVNANMHGVEALIAAGDVTGDARWHDRALAIAKTVALSWAEPQDWRIPEHFSPTWEPQLELNADRPDDKFKPYGATVGHGIEWARLLLHLDATFGAGTHPWLASSAQNLYNRAVADGWHEGPSGKMGLVYTTGWDGVPLVTTRLHWVAAEALSAAAALYQATGNERYARDYEQWFNHITEYFLDAERGSWHHELNTDNEPTAHVWPGKPDIYHAFQAVLMPLAPLAPSLASSAGRL